MFSSQRLASPGHHKSSHAASLATCQPTPSSPGAQTSSWPPASASPQAPWLRRGRRSASSMPCHPRTAGRDADGMQVRTEYL
eukprot:3840867-Pleurochrysis_carterae.AAC.1